MNIPDWIVQVFSVLNPLLPGGILTVWCLFAVNWRKAWPVLSAGGWLPLALVVAMAAYVWAQVYPRPLSVLGLSLGNGWWQMLAAGLLTGYALFLGWVQGVYGWAPEEISLDPPPAAHGDHHHHGH